MRLTPLPKSLKELETPVFLVKELVNFLEANNGTADLNLAMTAIFKDPYGKHGYHIQRSK